ncbi:hypothetical protein BRC86_01355 [Halobacteriales archaeon QS_3_64_16]|nr:MAG: hypothetical protein BRC86_01355 [Halobacteriales archaeon QS_3_64_16]
MNVPGSRRRLGVLVAATAAAALGFIAHYEVLSYWFTGPDTLTLIETSRITDRPSAVDTLTAPLMHGTNFVRLTGLFYRPIASLSYAIDYAIWGLDPFGYHLTDLLAHATAAALVVALLAEQLGIAQEDRSNRARTSGLVTAALAGGLFAIHPLTAEVVPVPARRHDVLATLFILAALWALARGLRIARPGPKLGAFGLSALAYTLALGSKEIGALLAPLALTWVALDTYGHSGRLRETVRRTVLAGIGYGALSIGYLALRFSLLGGIGGYVGPFGGVKDTPIPVIVSQYFLSLFYSVDVFNLGPGVTYVPATIYVVLAVWIGLFAVGIVGAGGFRSFFCGKVGRLAIFYSVWLVLPVPLIVRVGEYSPWTGYIALVPVAALTVLVLTIAGRGLYRALAELARTSGSDETRNQNVGMVRAGSSAGGSLVVFVLAVLLVVSLVAVSPLAQPYDGWSHASDVTREALTEAEPQADDLPSNAVLKVEGLPNVATLGPPTEKARVKSLRYFWAHTVRSWVRLRNPGSRLSTFTYGRTVPVGEEPVAVQTCVERRPNAPAVVRFRYESEASNRSTGT